MVIAAGAAAGGEGIPLIQVERLHKSFDGAGGFAVRDVSFDVARGELLVLLGSSGSGKTTTLKMINRLIEPSSGTVRIDGEDHAGFDPVQLRRQIGYVFQMIGLFPHLTVAENVAAVPRLLGWERARIARRVDELLSMVELAPGVYGPRYPRELSGGQRQRVGFARALAAEPKLMLLDEPFGALDPVTRATLQQELKRLHRSLGLTAVMVTHDMTEALLLADRIAVMHEGQIVRTGTPHELLTRPDHPFVESLLKIPRQQADELEALAANGGRP